MRIALLAAAALVAVPLGTEVVPAAKAQEQAVDPALTAALAHSRRADDRARDIHRHPAETLSFFQVKPGMTGWAQVNGRNAISWEQKFEYDVWYVDNLSLWLDIKIIFLTVKRVFFRDGINAGSDVKEHLATVFGK